MFDLDATLLNEESVREKALRSFYNSGYVTTEFTVDELIVRSNKSIDIFYPQFIKGTLSFQEQRRERLKWILKEKTLSNSRLDDLFDLYLQSYETNWELFDDVLPVLQNLSKWKLRIITNGNSVQQRKKIERLSIESFVETIVISDEMGFGKPDPRIFNLASERMMSSPSNCMYVGDKLKDDAIASCAVGMKGVWLNRKTKVVENKVTTFNSLWEISNYLSENSNYSY